MTASQLHLLDDGETPVGSLRRAPVVCDLSPLPLFWFNLVAADCPWDFKLYSEESGGEKSAHAHYETMTVEELCAMRVGDLAGEHCLLLLWNCGWMRPSEREAVMRAWGFTYKSEMIWLKRTKNGKHRVGTGYRTRSMHEPVYIGTIGNPKHKAFPSVFDGLAREHSRKPEEFYALVDKQCPKLLNRLDLFSRQTRPGWIGFGDENTKFDKLEAA